MSTSGGVEKEDELEITISKLQGLIAGRVRNEQRRDQLTGLRNGLALMDELAQRLESNEPFWIAFLEVDQFKSLNNRFGHANADAILRQIAEHMRALRASFASDTISFRAHGDEFFYIGRGTDHEMVAVGLEAVRMAIAAIHIPTDGDAKGVMSCTVSIGWLTSDFQDLKSVRTERVILDAVERAVSEAKRNRNCVVRYTADLKDLDWVPLRTDCKKCDCRFTLDVKRERLVEGNQLHCPNCGESVKRPHVPDSPGVQPSEPQRI